MSISGRALHVVDPDIEEDLARVESCRRQGLALLLQRQYVRGWDQFKLSEFNLYDYMPSWVQPLVGSPEERAVKLRDPVTRAAMKRDVEEWPFFKTEWSRVSVVEVVHERNYEYEGMTIQQLAENTGKHPVDAFLDLAVDEALETEFLIPFPDSPDALERAARQLKDPYAHISLSGRWRPHQVRGKLRCGPCTGCPHWIRDKELMSLEEAHYKMSTLPAWLADFNGRGTLRVGDWADISVYNLEELGLVHDRPVYANDFPGGERRLIQKPKGLRYTLMNGTVTFEGNDCTGALPGKLLRSYDMVG